MPRGVLLATLCALAVASCATPDPGSYEIGVVLPGWDLQLRFPELDFRARDNDLRIRPLNDVLLEVDAMNFGLSDVPVASTKGRLRIQGRIRCEAAGGRVLASYEDKVTAVSTGREPPPAAVAMNYPPGTTLQVWESVPVVQGRLVDGTATLVLSSFADAQENPVPPDPVWYEESGDYWENRERNNGRENRYRWDDGGDGIWFAGEPGSWELDSSQMVTTQGGL